MREPPRRRSLLCRLAAGAVFGAPGLAAAHAVLLDSQPGNGGSVAAGPAALRLRFNSRIDRGRSRLTLIGPDRTPRVLVLDETATANLLAASATLEPGAYVLRWQVLAIDGHITRGELAFGVLAR